MSWIVPNKILAMASPWATRTDLEGSMVCRPADLVPYLKQHDVRVVVQCNDPSREEDEERARRLGYDPEPFVSAGIQHVRLAFEDGGCPKLDLVARFLEIVETGGGAVAVHCRSGLGRTATLIGTYCMKHLGFGAHAFIGWSRLVRPGTVHGSQQQYLANLERHLRPNATWPLQSLSRREALGLLPRRELRFWALEVGVPTGATRDRPEAEIIEMILARDPPEGNARGAAPDARRAESEAAPGAPRPPPTQAPASAAPVRNDEWDEVTRCLELLTSAKAQPADDGTSWEDVRRHVAELRSQAWTPGQHDTNGALNPAVELVRQRRLEQQSAAHKSQLEDLRQQFSSAERSCEQLQHRLDLAVEQRQNASKEHGEVLQAQLREKQERLRAVLSELEDARQRQLELVSEAEAEESRLRSELRQVRDEVADFDAQNAELGRQVSSQGADKRKLLEELAATGAPAPMAMQRAC